MRTTSDRANIAAARWLAAGLSLTAAIGSAPALWHLLKQLQNSTGDLPRWSLLLLLLGALQLAYAVYLAQLPDWTSAWVVTVVALLLATGYALVLGLSVLAGPQSPLGTWLDLPAHSGSRALNGWCFIMLSITSLLAYFGGQFSTRWFAESR